MCRETATRPFQSVQGRDYHRCPACHATFLDPAQRPAPEVERAEYTAHENDPADPGYRRFLARLADPLLARLSPGASVLDYGCGPGPALAAMLDEAGHRTSLYDPFFHPDPAVLAQTYDAVTCTEAVEHFHHPAAEFDRLAGLLRPGGVLAVMTCFQTDDSRFADWHYRRDPTHVVFYREETFHHIAAARAWRCETPARNVAFLTRPPGGGTDT
ncbi:methyltransferase-related protein [Caenispirillum salinarum AK4]|uniref:Methyltransferase-related protein n=1 Tax=Caenispirillum salinarum AK4 TaxID=1238182 RepID=K9GUZ8_9PROT|nr:methyltransferase-related protein [Caenispirillum salinarum AK4]